MDRPVSMISLAATIRYDIFDEEHIFWDCSQPGHSIRWLSCAAVWRSKKRFHLRTNLDDLVRLLQGDPRRFQVVMHSDDTFWVRAL